MPRNQLNCKFRRNEGTERETRLRHRHTGQSSSLARMYLHALVHTRRATGAHLVHPAQARRIRYTSGRSGDLGALIAVAFQPTRSPTDIGARLAAVPGGSFSSAGPISTILHHRTTEDHRATDLAAARQAEAARMLSRSGPLSAVSKSDKRSKGGTGNVSAKRCGVSACAGSSSGDSGHAWGPEMICTRARRG